MKKLLCALAVLAIAVPAVAATEVACWADQMNQIKDTSVRLNDMASRIDERWSIVQFDLSGVTDADDIVSATLRLRTSYIEDCSTYDSRQPDGDSNVYVRFCPMIVNVAPTAPSSTATRTPQLVGMETTPITLGLRTSMDIKVTWAISTMMPVLVMTTNPWTAASCLLGHGMVKHMNTTSMLT